MEHMWLDVGPLEIDTGERAFGRDEFRGMWVDDETVEDPV
tara:strand:- start:202 stop:321 length:120 start_codon:yes stop_codon:yes gene_type:complete